MKARLEKIEARAKALGWLYEHLGKIRADSDVEQFALHGVQHSHKFHVMETGILAAERLLSLYEPGPMMLVEHYQSRVPDLRAKVTMKVDDVVSVMSGCVAKAYPAPGTFKLVRID